MNLKEAIKNVKPEELLADTTTTDEVIIARGGEIKAAGNNKLSGYAVVFTDKDNPDLTGEYFTAKTDFNLDYTNKSALYYDHGQNEKIGLKKIGSVTFKQDEVGIFFEAELEKAAEYQQFVAGIMKMAKAGVLGNSSASAAHLVHKTKTGKASHIDTWPLIELSLTPTPAEPKTVGLLTLKNWNAERAAENTEDSVKAIIAEMIEQRLSIWDLTDLLYQRWWELRKRYEAGQTLNITVDAAPAWEAFINEFSRVAITAGNKSFGGADDSAKSIEIPALDGVEFAVHSKAVLAIADEFVIRTEELAEIRNSEGKKAFNGEREIDLKAIGAALIASGERIKSLLEKTHTVKPEANIQPEKSTTAETLKRLNAVKLQLIKANLENK